MLNLFTAQASNATGTAFAANVTEVREAVISVWGAFGGGTVTVQYSFDGTNWIDFATPFSKTAAGSLEVLLPPGATVRAVLTGATAPSINCRISW